MTARFADLRVPQRNSRNRAGGFVLAVVLAANILVGVCAQLSHVQPVHAQPICGEWVQVDPPAGATSAVIEVEARSATDAFAFAYGLGLIRWDGTSWNQFPVPIEDLNEWPTVWIERLTLIGESHLFLAGRGDTGPFSNDQVLMVWDGTDWNHASVTLQPNIQGAPRNGAPSAVVGAAPDDVWIVGIANGIGDGVNGSPVLTVHWDGSELTEFFTPGVGNRQNNLYDAVAIATDDVWAVGDHNNTGTPDPYFHGMIFHWDGSSWSAVPNPSEAIDSSHLNAVDGVASNDIWAAGDSPDGPLFMHWDGSSWTIVPSPASTGTVHKLAAIASDNVWAVDTAWQAPVISKYYHWDGIAWSVVTPPEVPGAAAVNRHGGLAAAGPCDVWAVGSVQVGQTIQPLIERLVAEARSTATSPASPGAGILAVSPNPVDHLARIRFESPGDQLSRVQIYDVRGQLVRTLVDRTVSSSHGLFWDGRDQLGAQVSNGVYHLRVESRAGHVLTTKVSVVK